MLTLAHIPMFKHEKLQTAVTRAVLTTAGAVSNPDVRGFGEILIRTGDQLTPDQTVPFLTIALAAAGGRPIIIDHSNAEIRQIYMSGLVLTIERRKKHASLVLVGPKIIIDRLSPAHIHAVNDESRFMVQTFVPDVGTQTVYFLNDCSLWHIDTENVRGAIRTVSIDQYGALSQSIPHEPAIDPPAFSIVFLGSFTKSLRHEMQGLDVYVDSFA